MKNSSSSQMFSHVIRDGVTKVIDLEKTGCDGFITGEALAGTLTLTSSNDGVTEHDSQAIAAGAPAQFAGAGPFKFLHCVAAGGDAIVVIQ